MSSFKNRKSSFFASIALLLLVISLAVPGAGPQIAFAQEATAEPSIETTPEVIIETPIPTEVPPAAATPSPDPVVPELTAEPTQPEVTVEPTVDSTPDGTPEAPVEPTDDGAPTEPIIDGMFIEDFTGWTGVNWLVSGWTLASEGDNPFLQTNTANATATILPINWADVLITASLRIESGNTASIFFRTHGETYRVMLDKDGNARLYFGAEIVSASEIPTEPNETELDWFVVTIQAQGSAISVFVNGEPKLTYADTATDLTLVGNVVFVSGETNTGLISLDNISVTQLDAVLTVLPTEEPVINEPTVEVTADPQAEVTPEIELTPEVTPEVLTGPILSEAGRMKVEGQLSAVIDAYLVGDSRTFDALIADNMADKDEFGRIKINIWSGNNITGEELAQIVENMNGYISSINAYSVQAFVLPEAIIALANSDSTSSLHFPARASSTGPVNGPTGAKATEGFDLTSAQDWHLANLRGAGVKVGVIDVGFQGISTSGEYACVTDMTPPAPISNITKSTHGRSVVEVICDIAPDADVAIYPADDYASLYEAVSIAQDEGVKVIVIAIDLGAYISPGDGTLGWATTTNPYTAIDLARSNGIVVIAAAGNGGNNKYKSFNYGGTLSVNVTVPNGGTVNVSWNNWGNPGSHPSVSLSGGNSADPSPDPTVAGRHFSNVSNCGGSCTLNINGGSASLVQVQVIPPTGSTATATISTGGNLLTTGTLARPADSRNVIAVGAVCWRDSENFPLLPDSSYGPRFSTGGNAPGVAEGKIIKPDILGPSNVSTSLGENVAIDCADTINSQGFGGTSAAAAHVGGMAALLLSNTDNEGFGLMQLSNATAPNEVKRYFMTHSTDMPFGELADGWDMIYGAGLATLGSPSYNWAEAINPLSEADGVDLDTTLGNDCTQDKIYVGQGAPFFTSGPSNGQFNQDGTKEMPWASITHAVNLADEAGDCIFIMPGEYVTPILLQNVIPGVVVTSYKSASGEDVGETHLWPKAMYLKASFSGGIYLDGVNNIFVNGLVMNGTRVFDSGSFSPAQAVVFDQANNSMFSNSVLENWVNVFPPISVAPSTVGAQIKRNTFRNHIAAPDAPIIQVINSGSLAFPIEVNGNIFDSNIGGSAGFTDWTPATIQSFDSHLDIMNNVFYANEGEVITQTRTTAATDAFQTRYLGNVFQENIVRGIDLDPISTSNPINSPGPLVHLYYNRNFYFMNNTVVDNNISQSSISGAIIGRGDNNVGTNYPAGGHLDDGGSDFAAWEIHNNIIYRNNLAGSGVLAKDTSTAINVDAKCRHLADPNPGSPNETANDNGATFNWIFGNIWSSQGGGTCEYLLTNPAKQNYYNNIDPLPRFLGTQPNVALENPWDFFALALDQNQVPSQGIDTGDNNAGGGGIIGVGSFMRDVANRTRLTDGDGNSTLVVDRGAYEFSPITINFDFTIGETCCVDAGNFLEDGGPSGAVPFVIDLGPYVEGGFGTLTYRIDDVLPGQGEFPLNYGTHCGAQFAGTRGVYLVGDTAYYCPPRNFYTDASFAAFDADYVSFIFTVEDISGAFATGEVRLEIDPQDDPDILSTTRIGDGFGVDGTTPTPNDIFEVSVNVDNTSATTAQIQLRPFVKFSNFSFSENSNSEFSTRVQYPFTYALGTFIDPDIILTVPPTINPATGILTLDLTGIPGDLEVFYTVTDDDGGSSTNNKLVVHAVSRVPVDGLHDDTSFAFEYDNTVIAQDGWIAINSPTNINNTLHKTTKLNDRATFSFVGQGFVLYMQAANGGQWELKITEGATTVTAGPWLAPTAPNTIATTDFDLNGNTVFCTTQAKVLGNRILNAGTTAYTVTCTGMDDSRHSAEIINQEAKTLQVDAFSIIRENASIDVLQPGFHDVDEESLRDTFIDAGGWTEINLSLASNRIARTAPNNGGATVSFQLRDSTGFAIGTSLELNGASYDICVEKAPDTDEFCQRYDNSLGVVTTSFFNVFRPFYGLDPEERYIITVRNITGPAGGRFVFDSLVIFRDEPTGALNFGSNEVDKVGSIVFGNNGTDDTWLLDTNNKKAAGGTLMSLNKVTYAGPYAAFRIPAAADTVYVHRVVGKDSKNLMICVDRAFEIGAANNLYGNCIIADLQASNDLSTSIKYKVVGNAGVVTDVTNQRAQPAPGVIGIRESMFSDPWAATGEHTVEIFSLTNEPWNVDRISVADSTGALAAGLYEEFSTNIKFFDDSDLTTPVLPTYNVANPGGFVFTANTTSSRASNGGVVSTDGINNAIFFRFEGTGFSAHFRTETKADAVIICWIEDAGGTITDAAGVLNNGSRTCQSFDNQATRLTENVARSLFTIKRGTYAVAIQILGENYTPIIHSGTGLPITATLDALTIHDNPEQASLNLLVPGQRYEGNYTNRTRENNFIYYGTGWITETGTKAKTQSAGNFDTIKAVFGAGVFFRTDNADAVIVYRDVKKGFSPILICAAEDAGGASYINHKCSIISNEGNASQQPFTFYLNTDPYAGGTPGEYAVSIMTLDIGQFIFDAVEVVDVAPLQPGLHGESTPGIVYDDNFTNLILNGDMEVNDPATWIGGTQSSLFKYSNKFSQSGTNVANGNAIQSGQIDLVSGETYAVIANVYVTSGQVQMQFDGGAVPEFGTSPNTNGVIAKWVRLRRDFTATANHNDIRLEFEAMGVSSFYVDDVYVAKDGRWLSTLINGANGGTMMVSQIHGSEVFFAVSNATGFEVGTLMDREGGEYEICYGTAAQWAGNTPNCLRYENERTAAAIVSRSVFGLNPAQIYTVRVRDVEDGFTTTKALSTIRTFKSSVGRVALDFVRVYGNSEPSIVPAGLFDNKETDTNDIQYLLRLPETNWGIIEGKTASKFSESNYATIIDATGRASSKLAGPMAILKVGTDTFNAPATILLDINAASISNSDQMMACIGPVEGRIDWSNSVFSINHVDGGRYDTDSEQNCVIINARTSSKIVVSPNNLPLLGDTTADRIVTFRALTPGQFVIDGYQVLYGSSLGAGYYEEAVGYGIASTNSIITLSEIASPGTADWTLLSNTKFSEGAGLQTIVNGATMSFEIDGTGLSLITQGGTKGGQFNLSIQDTGGCAGARYCATFNNLTTTGTSAALAFSYAGLPDSTYTVTITANLTATQVLIVDAIEVYGDLQTLGSLYDDNEQDANGDLILTYGPSNNSWLLYTDKKATGAYNTTLHYTNVNGATVSFQTGDVQGILVRYGKSTSTAVEVCWTDLSTSNPIVRTCQTFNTAGTGNVQNYSSAPATVGPFIVSITNKTPQTFLLDSVQIIENGYVEGIYDVDYLHNGLDELSGVTAFSSGSWPIIDQTLNRAEGAVGSSMRFQMNGVGFSILMTEATTSTANSYQLRVSTSAADCSTNNIIDQAITGGGNGSRAISVMGLHNGAGNDSTFFVCLNNSATNAQEMVITGLHVISDNNSLIINSTDRFENAASQLQYFPFGTSLVLTEKSGPSGLSQHINKTRGAGVYFEVDGFVFDGNPGSQLGVEYVRKIMNTQGNIRICYGEIGGTNTTAGRNTTTGNMRCVDTSNYSASPIYQSPFAIDTNANGLDCQTNGCWVFVENLEAKDMPVDFIRLFDTSLPIIESGFYQQDYPAFTYSGSFNKTFANLKASGGTVARTTTINDTLFFRMYGVGASIYFTMDPNADAVRICAVRYDANDVAPDPANATDVLTNPTFNDRRTCQTFDNERAPIVNTAARTLIGLEPGYYGFAVQMLSDNYSPVGHTAAITMEIDAIEIFNEGFEWINTTAAWTNTDFLNVMTPGTRYEANYFNRDTDRNFGYYGVWTTITGTKAKAQSASNNDEAKMHGAGVVFRTDNANALTLIRNTKKDTKSKREFTPILICATPMVDTDGGGAFAWQADLDQQNCTILTNDGNANAQPISFQYNLTGNTGPHVISLVTLDNTPFAFDAIELALVPDIDSATGTYALQPGLYEATDPGIFYNQSFTNLISNGDMESTDGNNDDKLWENIPDVIPNTHTQSALLRFDGKYSRYVLGNLTEGIEYFDTLNLNEGTDYLIMARVYVRRGKVKMQLNNDPLAFKQSSLVNQWETLIIRYRPAFDLPTGLQFTVSGIGTGGLGEFYLDDVFVITGGRWQQVFSTKYTSGNIMQSQLPGSEAMFQFTGGGFEIGTLLDRDGGEVRICYGDPADWPINWPDNANCFTFQNESSKVSSTTSRTVAGLPLGTYLVTLTDVENGKTTTSKTSSTASRATANKTGKVAIDFVRILPATSPTAVTANQYDNFASDSNGNTFLELLPQKRWANVVGSRTAGFSNGTYAGIVDDNGRASANYAGAVGRLDIDVPAGAGNVTVIFYTGPASKRNTPALLVCAQQEVGGVISGGVTGELTWSHTTGFSLVDTATHDCALITSLTTTNQFVVDSLTLDALISDADEEKTITLTFQPIIPGEFKIDGYQIMFADLLYPGIHDDTLGDGLLNFTSDLNRNEKTCNINTEWCLTKNAKAFGGFTAGTRKLNNRLEFQYRGTGFSIITYNELAGADFRVCYKLASSSEDWPQIGFEPIPSTSGLANGSIFCERFTTNTGASWATVNGDRIKPASGDQYGFSYYGLPLNDYAVEVRMVDGALGARDKLQIDAIVVFSDVAAAAPMTSGIFDDTEGRILYEPFVFWSRDTNFKAGPSKGPYQKTETATLKAGAIVQVRVQGNAFILYMTVDTKNSADVRLCMVITTDIAHCGDYGELTVQSLQSTSFSQNGKKAYFSPIIFYGLGEGSHPIIIENRDHNKRLNVDAILIPE